MWRGSCAVNYQNWAPSRVTHPSPVMGVSVIICSSEPISQLLTTSWARATADKKRQLVSHTRPSNSRNSYPGGCCWDPILPRKERPIQCFIATTDDERDLLLACCCCCCGWAWPGCGWQLFLAGIIFTLWIWILFDLGSIPISFQTPCSSQRYPHIL